MKKIFTTFIIAFLLGSMGAFSQVIISQIYEGSSSNKFIEITNIGTTTVDLTSPQLTVKLFSNKTDVSGAVQAVKNLSGSLTAGQSLLLRHSSAIKPPYALTYTPIDTGNVCNFNGKGANASPTTSTDIITIYNGTTLVDVFSWGTFQYENKSYIRNASISAPNATWTEAEWTLVDTLNVNNAAVSTPERLGYHVAGGPVTPALAIGTPTDGATVYGANVNIVFSVYNFAIPTDGHIHYTLDGGIVNEYSVTTPIALTGLSAGSHKVVMKLVNGSHNPLVPNVADSVTFNVNLTGPVYKTIYQIQYSVSGDSPLKDSLVTTSGIVTASFASGYFIQDGGAPWNGLYVYDNTNTPAVGDSIVLAGTVNEYYNYTELKNIVSFTTAATGKPLPNPTDVNTLSVKSEQFEGMLVKITNAACSYVHATGWWKVVQNTTDTCEIGKLMFAFPAAVVGTAYNVTGLVNYSFGDFLVEPRDAGDIEVYSGINENNEQSFSIYPNPVSNVISISNIEGIDRVMISNILGETIMEQKVNGNISSLNVAKLQSGIYFVTFMKDNSISGTRKFIKL